MKTTIAETVERDARKVAKRKTQMFPAGASLGDSVRQGDVYVTLLPKVPDDFEKQTEWNLQLAPGTTQGSRHILDSPKGVTCYTLADNEFTGPVLVLTQTRELTHPEHGNWVLSPGTYGISYQRTQDALDQRRRVTD